MKKFLIPTIVICVSVIAAVVVIAVLHQEPVVPKNITNQANFVIFYPTPSSKATVQENTFKYDSNLKVVSFVVIQAGATITFSEQSTPDNFASDQTNYTQFIQKLNLYSGFESVNGIVNLTKPPQTNNEAAVMNAKGTLIFAQQNSGSNLSEDTWKQIFNSLAYTQPS